MPSGAFPPGQEKTLPSIHFGFSASTARSCKSILFTVFRYLVQRLKVQGSMKFEVQSGWLLHHHFYPTILCARPFPAFVWPSFVPIESTDSNGHTVESELFSSSGVMNSHFQPERASPPSTLNRTPSTPCAE